MSALSTFLENALINHALRNTSYTPPATLYVALFTTSGSLANLEAGTLTGEVSGGSYARQTVTFGAPTDGVTTNSGTVTFPQASANWGTIRFVAIMDAATSGNVLYYGQLSSDVTINSGNTFQFNASSITASLA